eukprot:TRINITY_DN5310_c0_g1_i10.p1 TRINITY_DN5310_c0_g1~~TRINITY_DN5310_c0_g1_i10.p1  ORF type:complete len:115 (+),score=35.95 TRINITY_DN5310_c0_g1_i10:78-422(+)
MCIRDRYQRRVHGMAENIANYLSKRRLTAAELFCEITSQQEVSVEGKSVTVDVIEAEKFYRLLKEIGIAKDKKPILSEFLAFSKDHPNIFIAKKVLKLIEYVKNKDHDGNNEGK